jgi:hypothetical protein
LANPGLKDNPIDTLALRSHHRFLMMRSFCFALACTPFASFGQIPANYQLKDDWLINNPAFKSSITADKEAGTITLSNGLLERTIDTRLGCTTGFMNLMTGESLIRAVEPEGSVTLNKVSYPIGGATGQPNKAFLRQEWLESMKPLPGSLELKHYEIGKPRERLKWKRVRSHAPDSVWPPKGTYLRLDYQPRKPSPLALASTRESKFGRPVLFQDSFLKPNTTWKIHTSAAHQRSSFNNEGKRGEIYTPPNTSVFAERPIPKGTHIVEALIEAGTDQSASWGPGIALVYPDRIIKFHLRPGESALGCFDGRRELIALNKNQEIDPAKPWNLRFRLHENQVHLEARTGTSPWKTYHTLSLPGKPGPPTSFRVGKIGKNGDSTDLKDDLNPVRLHVSKVAFYGPFDPAVLTNFQNQEPQTPPFTLSVHYEIYDELPALTKWLTVTNHTKETLTLDRFNAETLAIVENNNSVEKRDGVPLGKPRTIHVETDMAFGGFTTANTSRHTVSWLTDKSFKTQVNYLLEQPCLLSVEPSRGPAQDILATETFTSFNVFELLYDSEDRERRGLALRKMYRTLAPWVTENPLMLHCQSSNEATVRRAIAQASETGFEMVILSFGSGFNAENSDPKYLAHWKKLNDYALSKNIHLGSYSLYASRRVGGGNDIVSPPGERPTFGNCPAITSEWGQRYIKQLDRLFDETGFMIFENDGPYPGDVDVTPRPPLQKGINDSQWVHWRTWTDFYKKLRSKGVYLNLPDYYYLSGSNKCGMGYREVNWSLPREQQRIHTRQNIYDGTWEKTPSMGWMFVPLVQYHGGGAAATIEPLDTHCDHYEIMMRSNLGLGVQACYRGPRLYDTEKTKAMVMSNVAWYKKHRAILESDLIHGRRADGRDLDWMLHVNPSLDEKALLPIYNPTDHEITKTIAVPLYYSGLQNKAEVSMNGLAYKPVTLDRFSRATLTVTVPANGFSYYLFR